MKKKSNKSITTKEWLQFEKNIRHEIIYAQCLGAPLCSPGFSHNNKCPAQLAGQIRWCLELLRTQ